MIYDLQKPSLFKRLSAWLFDFIIVAILITGFATIVSFASNFDGQLAKPEGYYTEYAEKYDINLEISSEDFEKLSKEEQQIYADANEIFQKDERVVKTYGLIFSLTVVITAISILLAVLVWEFIVPLFLKNGQTVGKKIFGVAVMRTNGVKITPVQLFIRSILGKYTFEIMLPVFSVILVVFGGAGVFGVLMLGVILLAQIISLIVTRRTRSALHDLLSDTVTIDLASQLIFDTEEELIKYKEEQHAKMVERSPY
ncbi:MAG: RDD family protein [Clostridia bacterium]|nr:RDD family protein [Clostridia bacterium]